MILNLFYIYLLISGLLILWRFKTFREQIDLGITETLNRHPQKDILNENMKVFVIVSYVTYTTLVMLIGLPLTLYYFFKKR